MNAPAFSAQCATCLRVNNDASATSCPTCGSRRLVVLAGRRAAREAPPVAPQRIRKGSVVTLDSAHGPIERKVVKIAGNVLVVSREEEIRAAKKERRRPASIGFKRSDVLPTPPKLRPVRPTQRGRWGTEALRQVIAYGCGALNLSDAEMARELSVTREYIRQIRRSLGIPTRARREALAAARRRPLPGSHRPASIPGADRPLAGVVYDALLTSDSPHIHLASDGSITAPIEVAIAALQRAAC